MSAEFDAYSDNYRQIVERSISFSGLGHDFFLDAKIAVLAELFARHFGTGRPSLIDVGCGVGSMHGKLRSLVSNLAGTDVAGAAVARASAEHPWAEYRTMGGNRLSWEDGTFDASLATCVFHHIPVGERDEVIREMRRVTRPGGLVVIIEHNPWNPLTRLAVARCPFDADAVLIRAGEARRLLRRNGLDCAASRHFLLIPTLAPSMRSVEGLLRSVPLGAQYIAHGQV